MTNIIRCFISQYKVSFISNPMSYFSIRGECYSHKISYASSVIEIHELLRNLASCTWTMPASYLSRSQSVGHTLTRIWRHQRIAQYCGKQFYRSLNWLLDMLPSAATSHGLEHRATWWGDWQQPQNPSQWRHIPDSKVHVANMGPTWVLSAPDGPHVGPMNFAIRDGCHGVSRHRQRHRLLVQHLCRITTKNTSKLRITGPVSLRWRHNGHDCVSNHQPHNCLLSPLFGRRSK